MAYYIIGAVIVLWLVGGIYRKIRGRNKIISVIDDNCTGCKRCIKKCRHCVLDTVSDEKGAHVFVARPDKCTACGDCLIACKFKALELKEKSRTDR
ncbi:MAG: 4Fe-4S binding protein [Bacteroidales bacterium]|jgi:ferredoxin|nr:4Fe-4S binding protein [Bacteroidales bacterium]